MSKNLKLMWGTDPEAAAVYRKGEKTYVLPPYFMRTYRGVSSEIESNDPEGKHPVFLRENGLKIIEDGAAYEFTVAPSSDFREVWERVQECAKLTSEKILSLFPGDCEPELQFLPSVEFEVERWENEGEAFHWATRFGCDPQRDAFDFEREDRVIDASKHPWRYFGGHIHISGVPEIMEDYVLAVKCLAITAGCAAIAYSDVPALEKQRTFKYGIPGSFRVQDYGADNKFGKDYRWGIEYRTTSCRWAGNWDLAQGIIHWAEIGVTNLIKSGLGKELVPELENFAVRAILNSDQDMARDVLQAVQDRI